MSNKHIVYNNQFQNSYLKIGSFKQSRYNIYGNTKNARTAIYNTLVQNLVIVNNYELIQIQNGVPRTDFIETGLVVCSGTDEIQVVRNLRTAIKAKGRLGLSITLIPSFNCNFSCGYCYNGLHSGTRPIGIPVSVLKGYEYANKHLPFNSFFRVTWYGGEPLLFQTDIPKWTLRFLSLAQERNCDYKADLLTNGSLITKSTIDYLESSGVSSIQVSVDWPPIFSSRRFGKLNALETTLMILDKINLIPESIHLSLRINTTPTIKYSTQHFH